MEKVMVVVVMELVVWWRWFVCAFVSMCVCVSERMHERMSDCECVCMCAGTNMVWKVLLLVQKT